MPAQTLTIQFGGPPTNQGISVRGTCTTAEEAQCLQEALAKAIARGSDTLWVDCQQLRSVSYVGQQAIFQAEQQARLAHLIIYWCGMSSALIQELSATGLYLLLRSLPATRYQGPESVRQGRATVFEC
ncbi:STAS domain-containing protein [Hymenobacter glacieicola]|uniref:MlaB-like STAS domain-containing protein n=1 Tax=Hymenobacter glacieicola TaxID=1562124 RepID=A0ABQ1WXH4_9BACT|nr:anti-sigma factor antagonist [Hymenobacter glacieicola]GGG49219.1 hypothetical protein GCM10011378_26690 [Hymenobacter glacieicola]